MRLSLKPLVAAMLCLSSAAPALAATPFTTERSDRQERSDRSDARSPLAAMGGSTFDPHSLTGAVTLERVLQGLAPNRGFMPGMDLASGARATDLANEASPSGASWVDSLSPDQLAHLRKALSHSGVTFEYRVMQAQKISFPCPGSESRFSQIEDPRAPRCFTYSIGALMEEPTYLVGQLAHRGLRNATFVLSRPPELRQARLAEVSKPSCALESSPDYRKLEQARVGTAALAVSDWPWSLGRSVTLIQVSALVDQRVLGKAPGKVPAKDAEMYARGDLTHAPSCVRSAVWAFDLPSGDRRLTSVPNGGDQMPKPLSAE